LTNGFEYFNGVIDEARIHSGIESSNWVWASYMTVASNTVLENYSIASEQTPQLNAGSGGENGRFLSWPGSGVGFGLFAATNLDPPVVWRPVANQPLLTNNRWQINLPAADGDVLFFRLISL
jgi:hypothetical protein